MDITTEVQAIWRKLGITGENCISILISPDGIQVTSHILDSCHNPIIEDDEVRTNIQEFPIKLPIPKIEL